MVDADRSPAVDELIESTRANALIAWAFVAAVGAAGVESVAGGDLLWAGFSGSVVVLSVLPPLAYREPRVMLPWEVLGVAALPVLARSALGAGLAVLAALEAEKLLRRLLRRP